MMSSASGHVKAQVSQSESSTVFQCQLCESALDTLRGDEWLGDEVIYAFLLYVTRNTDILVIDPLLSQTSSNFLISDYPLKRRVCYLPLHMRNRTHWGLAVCDMSSSTVTVYDSLAHDYGYSSTVLVENEPSIRRMWSQMTNLPLQQVRVAGRDLAHEQRDGSSCGVFTCIYGERLAMGMPTKTEEPSREFLQSVRKRIEGCLRNCFVVSATVSGTLKPLPRIYDRRSSTQGTLVFVEQASNHDINPADGILNGDSYPVNLKDTKTHNLEMGKDFTLNEVMLFQCVTFCGSPNIRFLKTKIGEPSPLCEYIDVADSSLCTSSASNGIMLVVFYENHDGFVSAAVFQHFPKRARAVVFDFHCNIDAFTRAHLSKVGMTFGFVKATISLHRVCKYCSAATAETVSLCVHNFIKREGNYDADLDFTQIESHRQCISRVLTLIPTRYLHSDFEVSVARMYLAKIIDRKSRTILVDTLSTNGFSEKFGHKNDLETKSTTLVILYINENGDFCGAVVRKRRGASVCIVFDFSSASLCSATKVFLERVITSYGYVNCRFVIPFSATLPLHRSEFCVAVSYHITGCLRSFSQTIKHSMSALCTHAAYVYDVVFKKLATTSRAGASATIAIPALSAAVKNSSGSSLMATALHLGPLDVICRHCSAALFRGESTSICCNDGITAVPDCIFPQKRDASLEWLWVEARTNERLYYMFRALNNLVAFAGLSMNIRKFSTTAGQLPMVVQGSVDVGICHLNPDSAVASFAQLYICDDYKSKQSVSETMREWKMKIDYKLVEKTIKTLRETNVIAKSYKSMYEVYLAEMNARGVSDDDIPPKILMNLKHRREAPDVAPPTTHDGRLNVPQVENQIAAIYLCRNGVYPTEEELVKGLRIYSRGGRTIAAHHNYNIDAMSYPLYFPNGEQSFVRERLPKLSRKRSASGTFITNCETKSTDNQLCDEDAEDESANLPPSKFLSRGDFYRFVLSRRGNLLHHRFFGSGKLLSQFVIHVFTRIEADRLSAIGRNTLELRSCRATALYTYLDQQLQEKGLKLGKLINLPRNFVGSTSWYDQLYHNAMAVAQRVGKPDLFITFTGNQDWPEIRENLVTQFDSWITDPLLCARVFKLRLQSLIKEIVDKQLFGEVVALQYSVEYQKRGMPHAHILVTLREKLNTPRKIDEYISAEFPDYPNTDDPDAAAKLRLFNLVARFMVHRPCRSRPDYACRSKNPKFCEKHFPKPFREETELTDDGYPLYRRRNDGKSAPVGQKIVMMASNEDVIPYNAYLLSRFECHINVECCCSIMAFKYIFKYIYKGPDQIIYELLQQDPPSRQHAGIEQNRDSSVDVDMRKVFLESRYLPHIEAAYRLLRFPMQYTTHTVISLSAHLPDQQPVYFKGTAARKIMPKSRLLAYFDLVNKDVSAKQMTWIEVAEQYWFNGKEYVRYKKGCRRIARLWPVNPKLSELYALRKLLFYTRGASSFENLRTIDGIVYNSFTEAAVAAGLIETETEWEDCLKSAADTQMPSAIRSLFAQILLYCRPTNPIHLWSSFKSVMRSQRRSCPESDDMLDMYSINHIENILINNGSSLENCKLNTIKDALLSICGSVLGRVSPDTGMHTRTDKISLTTAQERIVNAIITAARLPKGAGNKLYYIDGKAGCGKTHTLNALIELLEADGKKVLSTASTGIAATLLKNGRTAHSLFCLPVKRLHALSTANVEASSLIGQALNKVDVIVWDEISMQSRYALECVERLLRDVAAPSLADVLFGGVTIVLGGDWCQFLPVIQGGTRQETINTTCKSSELWKHFITFMLDENLRLDKSEINYARWLLFVGAGRNYCDDDNILLPSHMCMTTEDDIINWIYTSEVLTDSSMLAKVALLTVRNCDVEELNIKVLKKLPGTTLCFTGIDTPSVEEDGLSGLPCDNEEYFHKIMPATLPPYLLRMKIGSIVMLLRNVDVTQQLCNGTRLVLLSILNDGKLLICKNLINGELAFIHRMNLDYTNEKTGISFRRFQFPIRLAFCMTINKSQGQTFDKVGVILRTPSFAHGSTYVALSRCTSSHGIKVTRNWLDAVPLAPKIRNVVYDEITDF